MSDAGLNEAKSSSVTGPKPKLCLLSSKQSGIRINSDDYPDQQQHIARLPTNIEDHVNITTANIDPSMRLNNANSTSNPLSSDEGLAHQSSGVLEPQTKLTSGGSMDDANKMNITKEDLLRLLTMLRSELQSKEIALAAIKCEQLKRLINPVEISRSSLASTYTELQDRFKALDQNNNPKNNNVKDQTIPNEEVTTQDQSNSKQQGSDSSPRTSFDDEHNRESLHMLNTLLELLDRHPLLALPRDSIYCLDYNCNELSTKNYLNLKIHHLDNLINQHRRYRFHMNERLKRSEKRNIDLARELELERSLRDEKLRQGSSVKAVLLKHIERLTETIDKEKASKQAVVMTLLNDLLDEREKNAKSSEKIAEYESKLKTSSSKGICENEKLLSIEKELDNLTAQLKRQATLFAKEKSDLTARVLELEAENSSLKAKNGLVATSKTVSLLDGTRGQTSNANSSPVGRSNASKLASVNSKVTEIPASRITNASSVTRTPSSNRTSPPSNSTASSASRSGSTNNGNPQINPSVSRQTPTSTTTPLSNQKVGGKPLTTKGPVSQQNEPASPAARIQPLFKSASVSSTNQQVKGNLRSPHGNGGAQVAGSDSGAALIRSSSTANNNQTVTKPQVPAKPAQLLEHQRSSLS